MYATADRTYLATSQWLGFATPATASGTAAPAPQQPSTQLHVFDTSGRSAVTYLGGGEVAGSLLDQFSMDEYNGDLRVATTTQPQFVGGPMPGTAVDDTVTGPAAGFGAASTQAVRPITRTASQSQVTVLRLDGDRLTPVGSVTGLGVGEQIHSVRFMGPTGYVVTFRRTDPLYTIDLSDPAAPKVAGALKLLGYSAYLHPAGHGLLLGVGQDADAAGHVGGLQVSLFDVADPAAPKRIARTTLPQNISDALSDHHAFTFADGLVLIPFQGTFVTPAAVPSGPAGSIVTRATPLPVSPGYPDAGVLAIRLDGRRLSNPTVLRMQPEGGTISPNGTLLQPLRTYVDTATIWTVTTGGLGIHDEASLRGVGFIPFD
jgi:hypothetical protein